MNSCINEQIVMRCYEEYMVDYLPTSFPNEFFKTEYWYPVTEVTVPGIRNGYTISTWGRFHSMITGLFYPNESRTNTKFYANAGMKLYDGTYKEIQIHRLLMLVAKYRPDNAELEVNHIDGIKYHNWLWNLEWVSPEDNQAHAVYSRLATLGKAHNNYSTNVISGAQAIRVANYLSKQYTMEDITDILLKEIPGATRQQIYKDVQTVANNNYWSRFVDENSTHYGPISTTVGKKWGRAFTLDQINEMCRLFEYYGTGLEDHQVLNILGFNPDDFSKSELVNMYSEVSRIRHKRSWKDICSKYNY
jgi:hypothetical protein